MHLDAKSVTLAPAAAQEEKEYYLRQIKQEDNGQESGKVEMSLSWLT